MIDFDRYERMVPILIIALFIGGCSGAHGPALTQARTQEALASNPPLTGNDYLLQPGDALEVKFFYNSELNERVSIRPDGKISLQLINEVMAAGVTPSRLRDALAESYSKILKQPEITVIVREYSRQKIFVGGEVNNPGLAPMFGRMTVLQAILQSGGFKNTAQAANVIVIRNIGDNSATIMTLNLKGAISGLDAKNDIVLQPYDVVFVPKTLIAKVDQFVEQYIQKVVPASLNFGFSYIYNLKPEVQVQQ